MNQQTSVREHAPRVVCAWCSRVLHQGPPPASHGICENCRYVFEGETGPVPGRVAFFLGVDCGLSGHRFLSLSSGWLVCEWCGKQQSPGGSVCLVCNEPGEMPAQLRHLAGREPEACGLVCGACAREFAASLVIADWELFLAAAQPCAAGAS
ncbi:MAG: hypothetical protein IT303_19365 [Dehalococcoidia bacterium]|nr:hypothetical protein [Dehalococcoidia bacterium]